jgi:hypothetical protein
MPAIWREQRTADAFAIFESALHGRPPGAVLPATYNLRQGWDGKKSLSAERLSADPLSKAGIERHAAQDVERWRTQKWPADIERLKAQQAIYQAVLEEKERGRGSGGP